MKNCQQERINKKKTNKLTVRQRRNISDKQRKRKEDGQTEKYKESLQ